MLKRVLYIIASVAMSAFVRAQVVSSPNGDLQLTFKVVNGAPTYSLDYKKSAIVEPSQLGLLFDRADFSANFIIDKVENRSIDEVWQPVWGEYDNVRNNYNELSVYLKKNDGLQLILHFRLFNDGLGFRYELPKQPRLHRLVVRDELTAFNLSGNHTLFAIPGDYDTNEFAYSTAKMSDISAEMTKNLRLKSYEAKATSPTVQTPLLMKTDDGIYINIHEAALVNFPAMLLNVDEATYSFTSHLTPDKNGNKGFVQLPFATPWRTIIVSDDARDILSSQLIYNLNEPCALSDVSWIKPQKFIGVWWEMFIGTNHSWAYSDDYTAQPCLTDYSTLQPNGHHPANTNHVKEYIDFAANNGIDAVLVEGWNQGWEDWGSYSKNRHFSFTSAYPDFDVDELHKYAQAKGVQIIMHHETASNAADYALQLEDAFTFMNQKGYNSVKTGYVGSIIPRSEYHSSQWMVNHYLDVVKKAAEHHIMVDSHEAVRPTGLCRTYPNWVAQESARGGEFESMGGNAPDHTTILPFTRLKGGPMDYTPGILQTQLSYYGGNKANQYVHTTIAKQLALYLTMPSPIQMAADLIENYQRFNDAFQFIRDVPVDWSNSVYLEAEPGDYITVARKGKKNGLWYVGAITDENARTATINFDFLEKGKAYEATIYADAPDAHYQTNPMSYVIRKQKVNSKTVLKQHLVPSGGVAISLKQIE